MLWRPTVFSAALILPVFTLSFNQQPQPALFLLAAWPVVGSGSRPWASAHDGLHLNGFQLQPVGARFPGAGVEHWADVLNRANLGFE